ncbi:MAG: MFS transporter [Thiohalomonadaceae bacterium]
MSPDRARIYAWALYDWANSAFATTVMAGFFPVFFKQYWSAGHDVTESTFWLGVANSGSSLIVVLFAPLLGAIADRGGARKRFLGAFALLGIVPTAGLWFVSQGDWTTASALYVLATVGFAGSLIFYDALLLDVANDSNFDAVSALGFALGYLGGGLLFALNVAMTLAPGVFGLADAAEAVRWSFVTVAVWWLVFSVPLFMLVRERKAHVERGAVRAGLRQLLATVRQVRALRPVAVFLVAYWCYIDGVDTIIRMAVDYGLALGFSSDSLIVALLLVQFVGFPAALVFGRLGARHGPKRGIYVALIVYTGVVIWATQMQSEWEFYLLALVIGLVQGGVQSLSRSLYARLIPPAQSAEFFGFFNIMGKFAAILGPFLVGWTSLATGNPRLSLLTLLVLFGLGAFFLREVPMPHETPRRSGEAG